MAHPPASGGASGEFMRWLALFRTPKASISESRTSWNGKLPGGSSALALAIEMASHPGGTKSRQVTRRLRQRRTSGTGTSRCGRKCFLQQLNFGCWHGEGGCCWRRAAASDGDTRLILASLQGHKWVVKLLLVAGAEVNHAPTNGDTPLVFARQTQTRKRGHTQGGGGSAAGVGVDRCGGSRTPAQL